MILKAEIPNCSNMQSIVTCAELSTGVDTYFCAFLQHFRIDDEYRSAADSSHFAVQPNFLVEITSTSDIFEYDFAGLKESARALQNKIDIEIA